MTIHLVDIVLFILPIVLSSLILVALHFFPFGVRSIELNSVLILGTTTAVVIPVVVMLMGRLVGADRDEFFWGAIMLLNAVVDDLVTVGCFWWDKRMNQERAITLRDIEHEENSYRMDGTDRGHDSGDDYLH